VQSHASSSSTMATCMQQQLCDSDIFVTVWPWCLTFWPQGQCMPYIQYMCTKLGFDSSSCFYCAMLCYCGISCRRVSVCLSHASIVSKCLNVESYKQSYTMAQDHRFPVPAHPGSQTSSRRAVKWLCVCVCDEIILQVGIATVTWPF